MPRTKIALPNGFNFETQLIVRVSDLNYGNHLGNDRILSFLQEARVRMLSSLGLSELNIGDDTSLIQGDAEIIYNSEGFLGDEIKIEIAVLDFSKSSFDFIYRLWNLTQNQSLAIAKTRMVCFDYTNRTVKAVPSEFKESFSSPE